MELGYRVERFVCLFVCFAGYGPGTVSASFETAPPDFPGSPSHVVARDISSDSAVVCWRRSAVGSPFTSHIVEVQESIGAGNNVQHHRAVETMRFPNCSMVSVLLVECVSMNDDPLSILSPSPPSLPASSFS